MKRLTILGIIACVGLLVAPAAVFAPPGPPDGLDVNVASPLPLPVTVQPDGLTVNVSTVYRFEGFTDAATTGDSGGTPGMHAICRNQFGQFARLCTEEEFFKSTNIPFPPTVPGNYWLDPTVVTAFPSPSPSVPGTEVVFATYSGKTVDEKNLNCQDQNRGPWTVDSSSFPFPGGLAVVSDAGDGSYRLIIGACSESFKVLCCTPAVITP